MIYTIGYQSITVADILLLMDNYNIGLLIDVRSRPYSRKPEFNQNRLIDIFAAESTINRYGARGYIWKGDVLGGKGPRIKDSAIEWLSGQTDNVLLMCMENHPCDCHRYTEIGVRLHNMGVDSVHFLNGRAYTMDELKLIC
jgi:uncharacterized protein (DUF488 family)